MAYLLQTRVEIKKVANVTGSITRVTDNSLDLAGTTITLDANTTVLGVQNERLTLSALRDGQFVKVRAEISGASPRATTVELLQGSVLSVAVEDEFNLPRQFTLNQNYPNPFNPVTTISFDVLGATPANVSLTVYNVLGQAVRTLLVGELTGGKYDVEWNGLNDAGQRLASGIYLYSLRVNNAVQSKTMVLMK